MKAMSKVLLLALCAVLLVVSTVFATLAYLTSTDSVKNTFTFGQVSITLDEATVKTDGTIISGSDREKTDGRTGANTYHLIPGHMYTKDPTIHVSDDSEDCWLFVKLENGLKEIIKSDPEIPMSIEDQMTEKRNWTLIDQTNNIYAYNAIVYVSENAHIPVFDAIELTDNAEVQNYGSATIVVTAYAVQADGFNDAKKTAVQNATDAWNAAFGNSSN